MFHVEHFFVWGWGCYESFIDSVNRNDIWQTGSSATTVSLDNIYLDCKLFIII